MLQQNLKAVENGLHVMLDRSARFFDLFLDGAAGVVEQVKAAAKLKAAGNINREANDDDNNNNNDDDDDEAGAKALGFSSRR